jgi:hypothetical protein
MKFICIKPIADEQNIVCLINDVVSFIQQDEDGTGLVVEGIKGWCKGHELGFKNIEFSKHFAYMAE